VQISLVTSSYLVTPILHSLFSIAVVQSFDRILVWTRTVLGFEEPSILALQ